MAIITRAGGLPGSGFYTLIPTHWIRDPRLTPAAKAILALWTTSSLGQRVTLAQTMTDLGIDEHTVCEGVANALGLGYLEPMPIDGGSPEYTLGPAAFEQQYEPAGTVGA